MTLQKYVTGREMYYLGNDTSVVLMVSLEMVEETVRKKAKVNHALNLPAEMHSPWADAGKAKENLKRATKTIAEQNLIFSVEWYQKGSNIMVVSAV